MKLKIWIFLVLALLFSACVQNGDEQQNADLKGSIILSVDKPVIRCDGADVATFSVILTDEQGKKHDVTQTAEIYSGNARVQMTGNRFSTSEEGEYSFYAMYGLSISPEIKVTAAMNDSAIPADPQEGSTSFKHRMLLVQHTGTDCPNCPRMMDSLKELAKDDAYNGLYNHVASHSYNEGGEGDAAYSTAAVTLSSEFCSGYYPDLTFDLTKENTGTDLKEIKAKMDEFRKDNAEAGIAATVQLVGNSIMVNAEIKVAADNQYRIAVWVLEDGIHSRQSGATDSWYNTHDNALRYMHGASVISRIYGEKVGVLKAGEKKAMDVTIPVESNWNVGNCEVLLLVTSADADGNYSLVNSVLCQVGESVPYEYI